MELLIPLAAKSFLIAGITLLLLKLMQRRSAADRSFVAHLGLASIAVLPLALLLMPQLEVESAWITAEPAPVVASAEPLDTAALAHAKEVVPSTATFPEAPEAASIAGIDWPFLAYAVPAALLFLFTLIALARLVMLKAKSNVLVEPNWLTALARAQRRMGFKHGTALLTSDELKSPISWGLMRPVILLNKEAADAHGQAEAIIAHELAHVARLDWMKLLLSRVTVALFWFNPLVWLLAREAHQLREEAADDAVLGADIEDTEYADLLVGIARHECRGLLLGAHGVAPAKNSLARRVQRVLDVASARAPGGWRWTAAAAFFAAGMVVPLAALHLVPTAPASANGSVGGKVAALDNPSTDLPGNSVAAAAAAATARQVADGASDYYPLPGNTAPGTLLRNPSGAEIAVSADGRTVLRSPDGASITIETPDNKGRRRTVLRGPNGAISVFADASAIPGLAAATAIAGVHPHGDRDGDDDDDDAIERAIQLKAVGASREYAESIRRAAPHLRLGHDEIIEFAALRISPEYLGELASAGYSGLTADELVEARALGITGSYARAMSQAGYGRLSIEQLAELRAVGVTAADVGQYRRAIGRLPSLDKLVEMKALGVTPADVRGLQLGKDSP